LIRISVHRNGKTEHVPSVDPGWLAPSSATIVWVDIVQPTIPDSLILSDTFKFHPLSVEDAMTAVHYPKIEAYDGYLYVVLHGIDFRAGEKGFATHDVDFFIGPNYLVTVHDGNSRSIDEIQQNCVRNSKIIAEGPMTLFYRIIDAMVDDYRPEVEKLEERLDELEQAVIERPNPELTRAILGEKRQVSSLRRIVTPERDVMSRMARREFAQVTDDLAFKFRDVYDHLVRIADDSAMFQDRITGILDAHLTSVSNRLNEVMKVLTVLSTIFMPLTLLSGLWGMNIPLPHFFGTETEQFWWLFAIMVGIVIAMLVYFRRKGWI